MSSRMKIGFGYQNRNRKESKLGQWAYVFLLPTVFVIRMN